VKNEVKIQKLLLIGFLEFLEKFEKTIILNFSRNFRDGRSLSVSQLILCQLTLDEEDIRRGHGLYWTIGMLAHKTQEGGRLQKL
jgi:hypothetical protein